MEKKFKHRTTGEIATYKDGVLKSSGFCVEIGVEPSKEFWEEIQEIKYYRLIKQTRTNDWAENNKTPMEIGRVVCSQEVINSKPMSYWIRGQEQYWEEISKEEFEISNKIKIKDTLLDFNTEFYVVNNWQVQKAYAGITFKDQDKWGKYSFLSQEEAEDYIVMNKPCLSIEDFKHVLLLPGVELIRPLKDLVKQRL